MNNLPVPGWVFVGWLEQIAACPVTLKKEGNMFGDIVCTFHTEHGNIELRREYSLLNDKWGCIRTEFFEYALWFQKCQQN